MSSLISDISFQFGEQALCLHSVQNAFLGFQLQGYNVCTLSPDKFTNTEYQQLERKQTPSREQLLEGVICFPPASPGNSLHSLSEVMFWYQVFELDKFKFISTQSGRDLNLEPEWVTAVLQYVLNNAPHLWKLFEETSGGTKKWLPLQSSSSQISVLNSSFMEIHELTQEDVNAPGAITVHKGCGPAFQARENDSLCDVSRLVIQVKWCHPLFPPKRSGPLTKSESFSSCRGAFCSYHLSCRVQKSTLGRSSEFCV